MNRAYLIRPAARTDIDAAYDWYEEIQVGRGDEFLVELYERIQDIREMPERFALVRKTVRAAMLPKSKFVVYYRIADDVILIGAVLHARTHPNKWKRRK